MDASVSESIQNMVNQVVIYDSNDNLIKTMKNDEYIKLYGLMQNYMSQGKMMSRTKHKKLWMTTE